MKIQYPAMAFGIAALLGGCGEKPSSPKHLDVMDVRTEEAAPDSPRKPDSSRKIAVSLPQIAYSYRFGFILPRSRIDEVQKAHIAACDKLGPARCRMMSMDRSSGGYGAGASLNLEVDAQIARRFGTELGALAAAAGGEQTNDSISAEDLTKNIIDTDARVKAKELLTKRLTELLATRTGSVADLVAAERALADVQEELDAARSNLAAMHGRVAMSSLTINYSATPTAGGSLSMPVKEALGAAGGTLGASLGILIRFVIATAPWLLALWGAIKLWRRVGGRWPLIRWPWRRAG
jgi:hypothetical protein